MIFWRCGTQRETRRNRRPTEHKPDGSQAPDRAGHGFCVNSVDAPESHASLNLISVHVLERIAGDRQVLGADSGPGENVAHGNGVAGDVAAPCDDPARKDPVRGRSSIGAKLHAKGQASWRIAPILVPPSRRSRSTRATRSCTPAPLESAIGVHCYDTSEWQPIGPVIHFTEGISGLSAAPTSPAIIVSSTEGRLVKRSLPASSFASCEAGSRSSRASRSAKRRAGLGPTS